MPYLSPEERADNVRLSCCIRVRSDMELRIPEEILSLREYQTRVERVRDLTYDVREFRLVLVDPHEIPFRAGQYVNFVIPPYGDSPEPVYRAYSMSSPPGAKAALEFLIRRVPQGIATTFLFDHLREGDPLRINGPYGEFTLRPTDADVVMIAGSTGIAPIKSILDDMAQANSPRKVTLFFGVLELRDLFYRDVLLDIQKKLPNLTFIPALSRKAPQDNWDGETGLITDVLSRQVPGPSSAEAYLCGSPGMIDASIRVLHEKGITDDRIFFDKFA
ncbi:MAG: FAD-binding oxidoreductase [Planctomycetota bacterium]